MYYENKTGKIYYEIHGPDDADTIVFSHGLGANNEAFTAQVDVLKKHNQVIVWDMPYCGLSSPIDYKLPFSATAADFIMEVLNTHKIKQVVHVGQSLGSFVVQHTAYKYQERIRASVHIGSGPLYPPYHPLLNAVNPLVPLIFCLVPEKLMIKSFAKNKALTEEARAYMFKILANMEKKHMIHLTQEMYRDMVRGLPEPTNEPMLIIYGDHDQAFVKNISNRWHEKTPHSKLIEIKNAHHVANQDNPTDFNKALQSFLQDLK